MPGAGALEMSSPLAILKRAVLLSVEWPGEDGSCSRCRTVEVQQLLVGGLGGELLGVGDGLFERHDGWFGCGV